MRNFLMGLLASLWLLTGIARQTGVGAHHQDNGHIHPRQQA